MNASSTDADAPVQLERRGPFWFARLNRADKRNALNEAMVDALASACDTVAGDGEARALVIWGAGGNFCAGGDFGRFQQLLASPAPAGADPVAIDNRSFGAMLERIAALPVPTIGVVRGAAMGGGCGLACALDRVIAAEDASFAMPEVTLGVVPAQIAPFVARRIGATRARWLMLAASRLDARAALAAGIADVVLPASELAAAVLVELQSLALAEPSALRTTKLITARAVEQPLAAALDAAADDFARLLRKGMALVGLAAARERRRPAWHGQVPTLPEFT